MRKKPSKSKVFCGILLLVIFFLNACVPNVVTDTTIQTASNIDQLEKEISTYQKFLIKSAEARIDRMENQRARLIDFNKQPKARPAELWQVANRKDALELFEGVYNMAKKTVDTNNDQSSLLAESKASLEQATVKFRSQSVLLKSLSSQLTGLGASTLDEFTYWIKFISAIAGEISDAEKTASNPAESLGQPSGTTGNSP
ncbi:MAG: hypothetical protein WBD99_01980 [Thermodesulfobacteriota bacterium]